MSVTRPQSHSVITDANRTIRIDRSDLAPTDSKQPPSHFLLVCLQGLEVGKPIELNQSEMTIGRSPQAELVLPNSQISRKHARIVWMNGYHEIEDLDSSNGTFIGSKRVTRGRLVPGDIIQFGTTYAFRYSVMDDTEKELIKQLYRSSVLDALTGAYNREYFNTVITTEFKQAQSTRKALSLLLLDVDHFKNINDSFGHSAGDAVLIELVERLRLRLRPSDVLCRYGGEEFVIILRATEIDAAAQLAERLRLAVRTVSFVHTNVVIPVSISIGCASTTCRGESESPDALTAIADQRLYAAKHAGRDRVVYSD